MNTKDHQKKSAKLKNLVTIRSILIFLIVLVVLLCILLFKTNILAKLKETLAGESGRVTTISEASIKSVLNIEELSTAEYIYNAIAKAYGEDGTTVRYYVAYEGTIKAGFHFGGIGISIDKEANVVTLSIPEVTIQETTVDPGSLDYIFVDKKSETETIHKEAFELCQADLEEHADITEILSLARQSAKDTVYALVTPWIKQLDDRYSVEIIIGE